MIRFEGLRAPALDESLIDFESSDGKLVDLYNEHDLESVELSGDALTFRFVSVADAAPTHVRFQGVRNLRVEQSDDWVPEEAGQIDHLLIRSDGPWPGVVFRAGGYDYEFDCTVMVLGGA